MYTNFVSDQGELCVICIMCLEILIEIDEGEPRKEVWEASRGLRVWNSARNNCIAWPHGARCQAPSQQ